MRRLKRPPNGSRNSPTSIRYVGPFDAGGNTYPLVEWETDIPGSENLCNVATGAGCTAPPISAHFYPFWSLTNKQTLSGGLFPAGTCTWNFGNVVRHVTTVDFGKDAEYGLPELSRYGGTLASTVYGNPETDSQLGCSSSITQPSG